MIFLELFLTFLKIGIFTFGGGYSMVALIQNEVVVNHGWLSAEEFTNLLAVSQMTPGPIGINTATYTGYTAIVNAGYDSWMGVAGAVVASFAVILLPIIAILLAFRFLQRNKDNAVVRTVMSVLRLAVVGLIASAAISLAGPENFGTFEDDSMQFTISITICVAVFVASFRFKKNPILLLLLSGAAGFFCFGGL